MNDVTQELHALLSLVTEHVELLQKISESLSSIDDSLKRIPPGLPELRPPAVPAAPQKVVAPAPTPAPTPKKASPAASAFGERPFPDDLVKHYLVLAHENHFPQMNTFQREFTADVPVREGSLTDRQYAVAMKILSEFGYDEDRITDEWRDEAVPDHPFGSYYSAKQPKPAPVEDDDSDIPF